uniref:Putative secreted peptide n=1 Tax=Anopheles braziliensis TaxID=58242 RepID=A0A2M3ZWY8_9DIPT
MTGMAYGVSLFLSNFSAFCTSALTDGSSEDIDRSPPCCPWSASSESVNGGVAALRAISASSNSSVSLGTSGSLTMPTDFSSSAISDITCFTRLVISAACAFVCSVC